MRYLTLLFVALALTGCKTSQKLAEGLHGKAVTVDGAVFVAEVTPANDITHTPTGRVIIADGQYSSTPLSHNAKSYCYFKLIRHPKVLGVFGGSSTLTLIATDDEGVAKILKEIKEIYTVSPDIAPGSRKGESSEKEAARESGR